MAFKPCSIGGHRNPLRSNYFYVSVAHSTERESARLRLCPSHAGVAQKYLAHFEVNPEDGTVSGGDSAETQCLTCGKPVAEVDWKVFITAYVAKNERKDYWANIHVDCTLPEALNLKWGEPL